MAAGPGKTSYLLMAAVQYVHYPHYRALILRKTYADLSLPDAIMDRAISWWDGVEGARFGRPYYVWLPSQCPRPPALGSPAHAGIDLEPWTCLARGYGRFPRPR